jgi:hypothetical protein
MLLDDACHSIDSPNMAAILEKVKFPNYSVRRRESAFGCNGIEQGAPP